MKKTGLIVFAVAHLGLVVAGAARHFVSLPGPLGSPLALYLGLSGAFTSYNFYAPGVSPQLRASFDIYDGNGMKKTARLEEGMSREAIIRTHDVFTLFATALTDSRAERALTASWAAAMFERHPEAKVIVVRIERVDTVPLTEPKSGPPSRKDIVYEASYRRPNGDSPGSSPT